MKFRNVATSSPDSIRPAISRCRTRAGIALRNCSSVSFWHVTHLYLAICDLNRSCSRLFANLAHKKNKRAFPLNRRTVGELQHFKFAIYIKV
jgi:hypothetical protein